MTGSVPAGRKGNIEYLTLRSPLAGALRNLLLIRYARRRLIPITGDD